MVIRFKGGVGALGAVEGPPTKATKRSSGNGAPAVHHDELPIGLVDLDKRVVALEAQVQALAVLADTVVAQAARIEALDLDTVMESHAQSQSHDDEPWIAASVSRATWFRRRAQAASPATVIRLKARSLAPWAPAFASPCLREAA
jgi:hypothetical protein